MLSAKERASEWWFDIPELPGDIALREDILEGLEGLLLTEREMGLRIALGEAEAKIRPGRSTNADLIAASIRQRIANLTDGVER
jgi:hypothetical protein